MAIRDLVVSIDFDDININNLLRVDTALDEIEDQFRSMGMDIKGAGRDFNRFGNIGEDAMREIENGVDDATRSTNKLDKKLDDTGETGKKSANSIGTAFKSAFGIIAGFVAVDQIKDLGLSMVEAAADAQAMSAQFNQVFGADAGEARGVVENLGKDFGMVPNRIKPAYTQMTSMFKGLGMETGDAMDTANKAVTLVADAAAFYDKSFEDANGSLNSFIKGNYEGGESIGLFANETQLAAWASKNLGLDWKKLDEAGKQVARLEFAASMQEAAGATGQASRESGSYTNQLGNLQQKWTDLKAKLGEPILGPAISGLQTLTGWLDKVDTGAIIENVKTFGSYMSDTFSPVLRDGKEVIEGIWTAFQNVGGVELAKDVLSDLKGGLEWIKDNSGTVVAVVTGLGTAFATWQIITGITTAFAALKGALAASTVVTIAQTIATQGLNAAMRANPLAFIVTLIGLLVTAGVLLYQNWDTVKAKGLELWNSLKVVWHGIKEGFVDAWDRIKESAAKSLNSVINKINDLIGLINKIPGVNIPIIPKVQWGEAKNYVGNAKTEKESRARGSYATGLERVPYDGFIAETHKDEAILTARQSDALRAAGILSANGSKPVVNMEQEKSGTIKPISQPSGGVFAPQITIEVNGASGDEQTIARLAAEAAQKQIEKFWRQMVLAQA